MAGSEKEKTIPGGMQMGVINPQILEAIRQGRYAMKITDLKPVSAGNMPRWICSCNKSNDTPICVGCGAPKPEEAKIWRCAKCGWIPEEQIKPPKFCIECGDPFTQEDRW